MQPKYIAAIGIAIVITIFSCAKKHIAESDAASANNTTKTAAAKPVFKKVLTTAVPKVIVVNDKVAKKSFDGRLYYDVEGHRYWRNYNDGKYYLFNKSMYTDSAFIPH